MIGKRRLTQAEIAACYARAAANECAEHRATTRHHVIAAVIAIVIAAAVFYAY